MRAYVCGQGHVEYYFKGPEKRLVYPWKNGLKVDEILAYYGEEGFKDCAQLLETLEYAELGAGDFLDQYTAYVLAKMRASGESEAAIRETTAKMAEMAKVYDNPLINFAITFMEVFPVGLVTLVSAAILRRKPRQDAPSAAVAA
jgi:hypothetical protein